jgi:transitional endoplasmic reticulum ATPase
VLLLLLPLSAAHILGHLPLAPSRSRRSLSRLRGGLDAAGPTAGGAEVPFPNRLGVEEADAQDGTTVAMHSTTASELGLMAGDIVRLKGKRDKETLCLLRESDDTTPGSIALALATRSTLRSGLGDVVKVYSCDDVKHGTRVQLAVVKGSSCDLNPEELLANVLTPHYMEEDDEGNPPYRPACEGDIVRVQHGAQVIEMKVMEVEPAARCLVAPGTSIEVQEEPYDLTEEDLNDVSYEDIGGCARELAKIRELVELPMKHPKVFTSVGVRPPRGVLIHGPPGCGKTMIAKAVAAETGAFFFLINGPEVMSKMAGESEHNLRNAFEQAEANEPAIIFIDEIDAIAPRRDKTQGEVERRIVSQLLTLMDGLKAESRVVVIAATNRPNVVEPALRRFGRFDLEISIPVPDEPARLDILRIKTRHMRMSDDVDLQALAHDTQGYCGADLAQTVFESAMLCLREKLPGIDLEAETVPSELLLTLRVGPDHVRRALRLTNPSSLRETAIEVPNTKWVDIGGLEDVKQELRETVQYPVQYADKFEAAATHSNSRDRPVARRSYPACASPCLNTAALRHEPEQRRALLWPAGLRQDAACKGDCQRVQGQFHLGEGTRAAHDVVWGVGGQRARAL